MCSSDLLQADAFLPITAKRQEGNEIARKVMALNREYGEEIAQLESIISAQNGKPMRIEDVKPLERPAP